MTEAQNTVINTQSQDPQNGANPAETVNTPPNIETKQPEGNLSVTEGVNSNGTKPAKAGEMQDNRNPDGTFKKGYSGNPEGKIAGTKNFNTLFEEALKRIAKINNKEPDEFDVEIVVKGIELARSGDFRFYKDLQDRRFGKAKETVALFQPDANRDVRVTFVGDDDEENIEEENGLQGS